MTAVLNVDVAATALPARRHLSLVPNVSEPVRASVSPRVYMRRRFAALLVLFIVAGGALMASKALALGETGAQSVTVQQGQTLSEVAHQQLPDMPVSQAVVKFQHANNLNSMHVDAGEKLLIPAA